MPLTLIFAIRFAIDIRYFIAFLFLFSDIITPLLLFTPLFRAWLFTLFYVSPLLRFLFFFDITLLPLPHTLNILFQLLSFHYCHTLRIISLIYAAYVFITAIDVITPLLIAAAIIDIDYAFRHNILILPLRHCRFRLLPLRQMMLPFSLTPVSWHFH